ncbi:MAG: sensor histidine kinase [Prolixibacteraceae bacterium]
MKKHLLVQIIFWFVLIGINLGFASNFMAFPKSLIPTGITICFTMLVFYGNTFYLFPRFYNSSKNSRFILLSILGVVVIGIIYAYLDYSFMKTVDFQPKHHFKFPMIAIIFRSIFWLFLMQLISTIFMMQQQLNVQAEESKLINEQKLNTELKYLKAQINPHFLFNALNNIYSLSYLKSDKAPEGVLKLSNMLRYVLEDCQADHVRLGSEIEYIQNFIDFQQMKSPDKQNIIFDYSQVDQSVMVAPMLFITFIENSFKYSKIESGEQAFVKISMKTDDRGLNFEISNSVPERGMAKSGSGKGIENVKQRLSILYPNLHDLRLSIKENEFTVKLQIQQS